MREDKREQKNQREREKEGTSTRMCEREIEIAKASER